MSCIKGQFLHTPRGVLWEYVRFSLQKGGSLGINFAEKDQMTDLPSNITLKNEKKGNHICLCLIVWNEFVLLFIIFFNKFFSFVTLDNKSLMVIPYDLQWKEVEKAVRPIFKEMKYGC